MRKAIKKPTCLDFFAGSGLVAEGLKPYFKTIWANDICPKKAKVFCANHNKRIFHLGPIEKVKGNNVPEATLAWGSFPCQDLSLAGNMGGLDKSRSGLVWQWLRVMDELRIKPPIIVAENVVGLVSAAQGGNYRALHKALVTRGYRVGAVLLDALHWLPQSRKRIFVIAVDNQIRNNDLESDSPIWCHTKAIIRAAEKLKNWVWWNIPRPNNRVAKLDDLIDFTAPCYDPAKQTRLISLIPDNHRKKLANGNGYKVFPGYKRIRYGKQVLELRFDGVAGCLRTPQGGSSRQFLVIKDRSLKTRLLTIKETAALMGVRSNYKIPGTYNDGYKAMGDAVAVPVSKYLAKKLLYPITKSITK
ncbi:MAG: DNA cytosine methyltransferase [Desulfobacteraceae bacterium]|nr:DNA cytosine methyltransferase [Desulfobacteraceae bacterium]